MLLELTDDESMLSQSAKRALRRVDGARLRKVWSSNYLDDEYRSFGELGFLRVLSGNLDRETTSGMLVAVAEALGTRAAVTPFLSSAVLSGRLVGLLAGFDSPLYDRIASGTVWPFAAYEPQDRRFMGTDTAASLSSGTSRRLTGRKVQVEYAVQAEGFVVRCRSEAGLALVAIDADRAGVSIVDRKVGGGGLQGDLVLDSVEVREDEVLAEGEEAEGALLSAWARVLIAQAAYLVGLSASVLEMTRQYTRTRHQFGVPIGSFQAAQHHLVECLRRVEGGCLMVHQSAALEAGSPIGLHAETNAWVAEAAAFVVRYGHQLHGGVGAIVEHDMPLYSTRCYAEQAMYGSPRELWQLAEKLHATSVGLVD